MAHPTTHLDYTFSRDAQTSTPTQEMLEALRLLHEPDDIVEVRVFAPRGRILSGYYDHDSLPKLLSDISYWNGKASIHVTLNPVSSALHARAYNHLLDYAQHATQDDQIARRAWFLVDIDVNAPTGISATNAEHKAAGTATLQIRSTLAEEFDFPEPVVISSGNGYYLLYRLDAPNEREVTALIERALKALAFRFDDSQVKVDTSVRNPARLIRLPGTINCKGDNTQERPHRRAKIRKIPEHVEAISLGHLEKLATILPQSVSTPGPVRRATKEEFDLANWIRAGEEEGKLKVAGEGPWNGGYRYILAPCPWNAEHTNRSAYIVQMPNGAIAAGCHHNGCAGKGWNDLRALLEPKRLSSIGEVGAAALTISPPNATSTINVAPVYFSGTTAPPDETWIVPDFLVEGQPAIVHAEGGATKSLQVLCMALCIAQGAKWLGRQAEQRPVGYLDFELGQHATHRRALQISRGLGWLSVPGQFAYFGVVGFSFGQVARSVESWLADNPGAVLVIDSFGAASTGDMNNAEIIVGFMRRLRELQSGGEIIIDHQSRRQNGESYVNKGAYGSVYKENLARVIWQVQLVESVPGKALLVLRNRKNTFGPHLPDLGLQVIFDAPAGEIRFEEVAVPESQLPARTDLDSLVKKGLAEIGGTGTAKAIIEKLSEANPNINAPSISAKLSQMVRSRELVKMGKSSKEVIYALPASSVEADLGPPALPQASSSSTPAPTPARKSAPMINDATAHSALIINDYGGIGPTVGADESIEASETTVVEPARPVEARAGAPYIGGEPMCYWCPQKKAHCANCASSELCAGATPFEETISSEEWRERDSRWSGLDIEARSNPCGP